MWSICGCVNPPSIRKDVHNTFPYEQVNIVVILIYFLKLSKKSKEKPCYIHSNNQKYGNTYKILYRWWHPTEDMKEISCKFHHKFTYYLLFTSLANSWFYTQFTHIINFKSLFQLTFLASTSAPAFKRDRTQSVFSLEAEKWNGV